MYACTSRYCFRFPVFTSTLVAHLILLTEEIFLQILPGNPVQCARGFTQMELSCAVRGVLMMRGASGDYLREATPAQFTSKRTTGQAYTALAQDFI